MSFVSVMQEMTSNKDNYFKKQKSAKSICVTVTLIIIFLCVSQHAFAKKKVRLVTSEREPYIGENISNIGLYIKTGVIVS